MCEVCETEMRDESNREKECDPGLVELFGGVRPIGGCDCLACDSARTEAGIPLFYDK